MGDKYGFFAELMGESNIAEQVLPILFQNGFEDWDTVREIDKQILEQIGITDEKLQIEILTGIKAADSYDDEDLEPVDDGEGEDDTNQDQDQNNQLPNQSKQSERKQLGGKENLMNQQETSKNTEFQELIRQQVEQELAKIPEKPIEVKDLLKGTSYKKDPKMNQSDQDILQKITVLQLNEKKITRMTNLNLCPNLLNLHLFQNFIREIDSLRDFKSLRTLHLENNYLSKISGLEALYHLEKLYLSNNRICRLEGMQNLVSLKELQISNQKIPCNFEFEEESLIVIGETLEYLEASNANIVSALHFQYFQKLQVLKMARNKIDQFDSFLEPLSAMKCLIELDLRDNPITKVSKYRDRFVLMSKTVEQLDEKKILPKERQFLMALWKKKHGLMEKPSGYSSEQQIKKKDSLAGLKSTQVDGVGIKNLQQDLDDPKNPRVFQKLNSGGDFRANTINNSTKHIPKPQSLKKF